MLRLAQSLGEGLPLRDQGAASATPAPGRSGRRCRTGRSAPPARRRSRSRRPASSARMPPTKASGRVARMTSVSAKRAERQVEQHQHRQQRQGDGERQGAQGPRLALHPPADVEEVAGGQLRASPPAARAPRPPCRRDRGRRRSPRPRSAGCPASRGWTPGRRPARCVASWPRGMRVPSWPSISSAPDGVEVAPPLVRQPHHEVEPALPHPDLRHLLPRQPHPHGVDDVAGREPDARHRRAVHRDAELRQPGERLGAQVRHAGHRLHRARGPAPPAGRGVSRSGPKIRTERSAGVPPRPSSMRIPRGVVKSTDDPGHLLHRLAHPRLQLLRGRRPVRLQDHQHVGDGVRHRVLGALGAAGAAHHVLDLREAAQHVLHAVIEPVDLVQGGLGRQHGLQQQRPLVQPGHEVASRCGRRAPGPAG